MVGLYSKIQTEPVFVAQQIPIHQTGRWHSLLFYFGRPRSLWQKKTALSVSKLVSFLVFFCEVWWLTHFQAEESSVWIALNKFPLKQQPSLLIAVRWKWWDFSKPSTLLPEKNWKVLLNILPTLAVFFSAIFTPLHHGPQGVWENILKVGTGTLKMWWFVISNVVVGIFCWIFGVGHPSGRFRFWGPEKVPNKRRKGILSKKRRGFWTDCWVEEW